jgi:F-type H+-transporting ATPase subunit c
MSEPVLAAVVAQLNMHVCYATAIMIALPAIGASIGVSMLGSKFLDCAARQPEAVGMMTTRLLILAGLIDGTAIISIGMGAALLFANPFVAQLMQAVA